MTVYYGRGVLPTPPKIKTYYWQKPAAQRQFDWCAVEGGYEPGRPIGHGRTEQEAIADLKALLDAR